MQVAAADPQFLPQGECHRRGVARPGARHPSRPRAQRRQAREDGSTRSLKGGEQVLRRGLPLRAALHQGKQYDDRPRPDQGENRQTGRKHFGVALHPFQGGRCGWLRRSRPKNNGQTINRDPVPKYQRILLKLSGEVLAGHGVIRNRPGASRVDGGRGGGGGAVRYPDRPGSGRRQLFPRRGKPRRKTWTASQPITWACWPR